MTIRANMIADGFIRFSVPFNATPWFTQATEIELKTLATGGWCWNRRDSAVVVVVAAMHEDRLAKVLKAMVKSGRNIPFTCAVNERDATVWLRRYRRPLVEKEKPNDDVRLPVKRSRSG